MRAALPLLLLAACAKDLPPAESEVTEDLVVIEGGRITCADPAARVEQGPFRALGAEDGWPLAELTEPVQAWGLVVADLNDDGWLDILVPGQPRPTALLMGGGATWVDDAPARLPDPIDLTNGASAADIDGDGDLDLWLGQLHGHDLMFMNEDGVFLDKTPELLLARRSQLDAGGSWADADGDEDLDLFVYTAAGPPACEGGIWADRAESNMLYANLGEWSFADETARLPEELAGGYTQAGGWHDLDGDRTPDLLTVNDFGPQVRPNSVGMNQAGRLSPTQGTGLEVPAFGMGLAVAELNGDGTPDLLISDWDRMELLLSDGGGTWYDAASAQGLTNFTGGRHAAWSGVFGDIDNDADLDIFAAFGPVPGPESAPEDDCLGELPLNPVAQPDALWLNTPSGFVESSASHGVDNTGNNRGAVFADLNRDGFLDLLVRSLNGPTLLYEARCDASSWLELDLRQPGPNPFAVGAEVRVGDQTRWVEVGGTTINGSAPTTLHFGLGFVERADVLITWPDGTESLITGLETRQQVRIERQ